MDSNRREFLKKMIVLAGMMGNGPRKSWPGVRPPKRSASSEALSAVLRAVNGRSDDNLGKVIELMGGIERLIGQDDLVVIKPNVQWWNHGAPNLSALKRFVDLIMERRGGFKGEVIIAENCHRGNKPWNAARSGWTPPFGWNSDLKGSRNMNELSTHLKRIYGKKFSVCHWVDVDAGARRVSGPQDGPGYVYCDGTGGVPLISVDNGMKGDKRRQVIMTYPIFQTDKGTVVDFKNGVWEKGSYTEQPLRFVNFAALNHHSTYCGATSAIKNYLGIADLSGGPDSYKNGLLTRDYCNFHSFAFDKWAPGPRPGMLGAEIAIFMNRIRKADLNITTAEWIGFASRVKPPMGRTRAVLLSRDPVALDYHATKYLLYPNSRIWFHNPDDPKSPVQHYLKSCAQENGGVFDEGLVEVKSFDLASGRLQGDGKRIIKGEKIWGKDARAVGKYLLMRFGVR